MSLAASLVICAYQGVDDYAQELGARLKEAREAAGLSQQKAASRAEIDVGTLSKYELGKIPEPSMTKVRRLASLYGVRVEWLDSGTPPMRFETQPETIVEYDDARGYPEVESFIADMEQAGMPVTSEHAAALRGWRRSLGPADRIDVIEYHNFLIGRDRRKALERPLAEEAKIDEARGQRKITPIRKKRR